MGGVGLAIGKHENKLTSQLKMSIATRRVTLKKWKQVNLPTRCDLEEKAGRFYGKCVKTVEIK